MVRIGGKLMAKLFVECKLILIKYLDNTGILRIYIVQTTLHDILGVLSMIM